MLPVTSLPRPSHSTLAQTPARVLTFLVAIATRSPIRTLLYEAGFRSEDHAEGWRLLTAVGALREGALTATSSTRAKTALDELHVWVTTNFTRYKVALSRLHPSSTGLFPDVDPQNPAESLLAMATLIDALRTGSASNDPPLLTTLSQRGLNPTEIERLHTLIRVAQNVDGATPPEIEHDPRTDELLTLYHWYRDWAESAKRFVKRKDHRITLGLVGRRETARFEGSMTST